MTSRDSNGPGHHPRAATSKIAPQEQAQVSAAHRVVTAFGTRYLASGEATFDWVVVRRCPMCGHAHRHVLFEHDLTVIERAPSCARHRTYDVVITDVVPSHAERRRVA